MLSERCRGGWGRWSDLLLRDPVYGKRVGGWGLSSLPNITHPFAVSEESREGDGRSSMYAHACVRVSLSVHMSSCLVETSLAVAK